MLTNYTRCGLICNLLKLSFCKNLPSRWRENQALMTF
jgi:hypothetical protein